MIAGAVVAVLVVGGVVVFTSMLRRGFSALDEPGGAEAFAARTMRSWAVPAALEDVKNPLPLTPAVLAEGRAHWADHCALCHANDGKGSDMGKKMYPRAPDMTDARVQKMSDGELFGTIENGIRLTGMPGFGTGTAESAYGTWGLVHFIRHLPKLTAAELEEMRQMNPVSPAELQQQQGEAEFLEGGDDPAAEQAPPASHH